MTTRGRPKRLEGPAAFDIRSLEDPEAVEYLRQCLQRLFVQLQVPSREIDDLVQDVMITGVRVADRYDPARGSLQSWLEGIAARIVLDFRKRWRRKLSRLVPEEEEGNTVGQAAPALNPEQAVHAKHALRTLGDAVPEPLRTCFLMHAEGYTRPEIAKETGLSEGAVAHRLEQISAIRDDTAAKMGEEPKDGSRVRFGPSPLFAALLSQWQTTTGAEPSPPGEERPLDGNLGQPRPPRRKAMSPPVVAAPAALAVALLAAPLGWATLPSRQTAAVVSKDPSVPSPAEPATSPERQGRSIDRAPPPAMSAATSRPAAAVTSILRTPPAISVAEPRRGAATGGDQPRAGSDVLLRLASGAAQAGANETAMAALREHSRQSPATDAGKRADLERQARKPPAPP